MLEGGDAAEAGRVPVEGLLAAACFEARARMRCGLRSCRRLALGASQRGARLGKPGDPPLRFALLYCSKARLARALHPFQKELRH